MGVPNLEREAKRLLDFARASALPSGGFGYLDGDGKVDSSKPLELWINCRMIQSFGLGHLHGLSDSKDLVELVEHGVNGLLNLFEDKNNGGFFSAITSDGKVVSTEKMAYDHMFVLLAASTAKVVGVKGADELFEKIDAVIDSKFWDPQHRMMHNSWNQEFSLLDSYHGINANMHAVEALISAYEVTKDVKYRDRALSICERTMVEIVMKNDFLLPEHFDENWQVLKDFNSDRPADPFRPFGVTIGHLLEWARFVLQVKLIAPTEMKMEWADVGAKGMYEAAKKYGWGADGSDGFIYTMDWQRKPVVKERMHWVAAEAAMTSWTLHHFTGEGIYLEDYEKWWSYIDQYLIDKEKGSWFHELNARQEVSTSTWEGKPDIYHALNACLLAMYPMSPSFIGVTLR